MKKPSLLFMAFLLQVAGAVPAVADQNLPSLQDTSGNASTPEVSADAQKRVARAIEKLKLPLDHGPRAEVTPWVNQQRRLRAAEQARLETQSEAAGVK